MENAIELVREEFRSLHQDKARERASERLLDLLFPPPPERPRGAEPTDEQREEDARREASRDKLRVRLRQGDLDEREVDVEVSARRGNTIDIFGPQGTEQMGIDMQQLMGQQKKTRRKVSVKEARILLEEEEMEALTDEEKVRQEAKERAESSGIIFIDEIDKILASDSKHGPDVSREGVQRDLLPVVEGSSVSTKHGVIKTDHMLFVAAGAFHGTSPSDLIPELQGRFPIRVELTSLGADEFVRILTEPENALLKQYRALFASDGVELEFSDDAVRAIADMAGRANASGEDIGARRLQTVLARLLENFLYDVPDAYDAKSIHVDDALVRERLEEVLSDDDVRQYIL